MYVCNCNGVRQKDVARAIEAGARTPRAVHAQCGSKPQCCRCLPEIAQAIEARRRPAPAHRLTA